MFQPGLRRPPILRENKLPLRFLISRPGIIRCPRQLRHRRLPWFRLRDCWPKRWPWEGLPHRYLLHCNRCWTAQAIKALLRLRDERSRELTSQKLRSRPIGEAQPLACQAEPLLVEFSIAQFHHAVDLRPPLLAQIKSRPALELLQRPAGGHA